MYLSKLIFSPGAQGAEINHIDFRDAYQLHQWLWHCFDAKENQALKQSDFLYRLDSFSNIPIIHVLSQRRPLNKIENWKVESKNYSTEFAIDSLLQFSLRANPTVTFTDEGKQSRHDVLMHAKQKTKGLDNADVLEAMDYAARDWLLKKAQGMGVEFVTNSLEFSNYSQIKTTKEKGQTISFSSLDYQGLLKVLDSDLFAEKTSSGIGRAKAFGCGLMLLRHL